VASHEPFTPITGAKAFLKLFGDWLEEVASGSQQADETSLKERLKNR